MKNLKDNKKFESIIFHIMYCCVSSCSTKTPNNEHKLYCFPTTQPWQKEKRELWINAVKKHTRKPETWVPTRSTRICSAHFIANMKSEIPSHPSYVPSIFIGDTLQDTRPKKPKETEHVAPVFSQLSTPKIVPIEPFVPENVDRLCKSCAADTEGFSWWCVQCSEGALCGMCVMQTSHDTHYVLRGPRYASNTQMQAVLAALRQMLKNENHQAVNDADEVNVKTEIKIELEEPLSPLPEPVLGSVLDPALENLQTDSALVPKLETVTDPVLLPTVETVTDPVFDPTLYTSMETALVPALEQDPLELQDPLVTEPDDACIEVSDEEKEETLKDYLERRQRLMLYIKPFQKMYKRIPYSRRLKDTPKETDDTLKTMPCSSQTRPILRRQEQIANCKPRKGKCKTVRKPSDQKGSQTLQTDNRQECQTAQPCSILKKYQNLHAASNLSQTVINVTPVDTSQNKASPSGSQTVSKPKHLKIKRTLLKVPVSELAKSKSGPSVLGSTTRIVEPSELLKLKSVQKLLKKSGVGRQKTCSNNQKLHNVLKGFTTPLKVTSEPSHKLRVTSEPSHL